MKLQFLSSSLLFRIMQTESANHAESTSDAQEKTALSYEFEFTENQGINKTKTQVNKTKQTIS